MALLRTSLHFREYKMATIHCIKMDELIHFGMDREQYISGQSQIPHVDILVVCFGTVSLQKLPGPEITFLWVSPFYNITH